MHLKEIDSSSSKIFKKHVYFSENKGISKEELNKILMNLSIFPSLITKLEIKRIAEYVEAEKAHFNLKSPRSSKEIEDDKDKFVSYEDFEEILKLIAFKSFMTSQNQNQFEAIIKLINYIKEPAKIVYLVKLTSGMSKKINESRYLTSFNDGSMSKPDKINKIEEIENGSNSHKNNLNFDGNSSVALDSYHLLDYTLPGIGNSHSKRNNRLQGNSSNKDGVQKITNTPLRTSAAEFSSAYNPESPKVSEHYSILSEDCNSMQANSRRRRKDRKENEDNPLNENSIDGNFEIDYKAIEIISKQEKFKDLRNDDYQCENKAETNDLSKTTTKKSNKLRSNLNQENFRMSSKTANKNNLVSETFSSRAKQHAKMADKCRTIKKQRRELMTPKTPNDNVISKNWNKTVTVQKHSRQQSVKK